MNSVLTLDFGHVKLNPEKAPELAGGCLQTDKNETGDKYTNGMAQY